MQKTNMWQKYKDNPQNPKNIQISFTTFMTLITLIGIDVNHLSDEDAEALKIAREELKDKKKRIRNRQAYRAITHAQTPEEKQAAFENYHHTKELAI